MNVPPPRVREVLSLLGDLSPDQARVLLSQVVATLDAAEMHALQVWLPPSARHCLPSCVGAVTVMNEAPMPWEFVEPPLAPSPAKIGVETGKLIADVLPLSRRKLAPIAIVAAALIIGLVSSLLWTSSADEPRVEADPPSLVPLPPAQDYAPPSAPKSAKVKKVISKSTARKAAPRLGPNEWASPFDRRH